MVGISTEMQRLNKIQSNETCRRPTRGEVEESREKKNLVNNKLARGEW
jgi:hypothetical protein